MAAYSYAITGTGGNLVYVQQPVWYSASTAIYTVTVSDGSNCLPYAFNWESTAWGNISCAAYTPSPEDIAREKARKAKVEAATSRADQLLMTLLDDHQQTQLRRDRFFELKIDNRTYRINRGRAGNVQLVEAGKPVAKYCAHPDLWTPDGDAMIAQLMMLKTNEAEFLKLANRTALA